jgi:hypothetical protein
LYKLENGPRKLGSVNSQWYIIIIIIIYFLPIAKDVTNTETTVMYGLKVKQTVSIVPIHNLTIYNVGFWGGYVLDLLRWSGQPNRRRNDICKHSGPICVPISGRVRQHGDIGDEMPWSQKKNR